MLSIVQAVVMCHIVNLETGKLLKVGGGVQIKEKEGFLLWIPYLGMEMVWYSGKLRRGRGG